MNPLISIQLQPDCVAIMYQLKTLNTSSFFSLFAFLSSSFSFANAFLVSSHITVDTHFTNTQNLFVIQNNTPAEAVPNEQKGVTKREYEKVKDDTKEKHKLKCVHACTNYATCRYIDR